MYIVSYLFSQFAFNELRKSFYQKLLFTGSTRAFKTEPVSIAINLILTLFLSTVPLHLAVSASPDDDEQIYLRNIEDKKAAIAALEQSIADNAKTRQKLQQSVEQLNQNLQERERRLEQLTQERKQYEKQLAKFESQTASIRDALELDRRALHAIMQSRSSVQQDSWVRTLLSGTDLKLSARQNRYRSYLQQARISHTEDLLSRLELVDEANKEALKSRNWLSYLHNKASGQHSLINRDLKNSDDKLKSVDEQTQTSTQQRTRLQADLRDIETLLQQLRESRIAKSGYFEANKGRHLWPAANLSDVTLYARFGDSRAKGLRWNGLFIAAGPGDRVSAIADGEVVYADTLASMGVVVVLQHGDSFLSLYGGNAQSRVVVGDWVESGSSIATVGQNTGLTKSGIYLEIREKSTAVDPEKWLNAKIRTKLVRK